MNTEFVYEKIKNLITMIRNVESDVKKSKLANEDNKIELLDKIGLVRSELKSYVAKDKQGLLKQDIDNVIKRVGELGKTLATETVNLVDKNSLLSISISKLENELKQFATTEYVDVNGESDREVLTYDAVNQKWVGEYVEHSNTTNLLEDDHTQYLLLAGRNGQVIQDDITMENNLNDKMFYLDAANDKLQIGDVTGGNYSEFESDGSYVANGNATTYDDLLGDITQVKTLGTGVSLNTTESTLDYTTVATLNDYVIVNYQMSHKWKAGSTIHPHIHWQQTGAGIPNWLIQYRWQRNGQAKTTAWTNFKCNNANAFTYTSGTLNQISYDSGITPPSGYSLSDIIQFRVIRDTGNASGVFAGIDIYSGIASITGVDIHYEQDTLGSRLEYSK